MPFELTHQEELVRKIAREFAQREIIPHRKELRDGNEDTINELEKKEVAASLHLALVPKELGGTGLGHVARCIIFEELTAAFPRFMDLQFREFAYYFARATGGEVEKKWMPLIVKGEAKACPMVNEPQGGSDVFGYTTTARKENNEWVINGRKCFVSHVDKANFGMALVKTGDPKDPATKGARAFSAFVIEKGMPGFRVTRMEKNLYSKETASIVFDNVRVPQSHVVGEIGRGMSPVFTAVGDIGRLGVTSELNGCILGSYECSLKFAQERILYGKPISELQAIQYRLAEMFIDLDVGRSLVYRAAWLRNRNVRCDVEQSIAKYFATQAALRASLHAVNIHGGAGVMEEYMPQLYYRLVPLLIGAGGTDEAMKNIIARAALEGANPSLGRNSAEESGY
jgi:alkylation response protein AidB-like acyl-CoA dehydrogenase